jgi:hypothetical protein
VPYTAPINREAIMRVLLAITAAALLAVPSPALAQQDEEGCKDHPMLSRFPGYYISECEARDFSAHDFTVSEDAEKKVEGRYWKISYWLKEGAKRPAPAGRATTRTPWRRVGGQGVRERRRVRRTATLSPAGGAHLDREHAEWRRVTR